MEAAVVATSKRGMPKKCRRNRSNAESKVGTSSEREMGGPCPTQSTLPLSSKNSRRGVLWYEYNFTWDKSILAIVFESVKGSTRSIAQKEVLRT
jgi:hypothetical protein